MDDAVIISDIHLGSDSCEAHELWEFLEQLPGRTKQLILNGDVFDSIDFHDSTNITGTFSPRYGTFPINSRLFGYVAITTVLRRSFPISSDWE